MHRIQKLINDSIKGLPTLPLVANRVLAITADEESSIQELWEVVQADQSLAANVLKMANSAFFGLPRKVDSLQHALSLLGQVEVRNLIISQVVFNSFRHIHKDGAMDLYPLWKHAFISAMAASLVARHTTLRDHNLYAACLVHDLGKLVIYMALPEAYAEIVKETGPNASNIYEMEKRFLNMTHEQVTVKILRQWMFPDNIISGAGFHHHPDQSDHDLYAWIVHAVDLLVHWSDAVDQQHHDQVERLQLALMRPDMEVVFNTFGNWNQETLEMTHRKLKALKAKQTHILALFAS